MNTLKFSFYCSTIFGIYLFVIFTYFLLFFEFCLFNFCISKTGYPKDFSIYLIVIPFLIYLSILFFCFIKMGFSILKEEIN